LLKETNLNKYFLPKHHKRLIRGLKKRLPFGVEVGFLVGFFSLGEDQKLKIQEKVMVRPNLMMIGEWN